MDIARAVGSHYAARVRAFALVELGDSESIGRFLREEDAERALAECLGDALDWTCLLQVVPIELGEQRVSANQDAHAADVDR